MITFSKIGKMGRFGNELFQFATLYAVSRETGYEIGLNWHLGERYFNLKFKKPNKIISEFEEKTKNGAFNPKIFQINDNTDLIGYFQSPKYFNKYREELINLFKPKREIILKVNKILSKYSKPVITLHIRGSDYLSKTWVNFYGGIPNYDYYLESITLISKKEKKKISDYQIICLTDDILTSKKILKNLSNIEFYSSAEPLIDMFILIKSKRLIISASTFAFWGAYLNQNKNVVIYAPKFWLNQKQSYWIPENIEVSNWNYVKINSTYVKRNIFSLIKVKLIHLKRFIGIKK